MPKQINFDENAPMSAQKVKKLKKCTKQIYFIENAPIWAQNVKRNKRNTQCGHILMKTHQCECKKSEKFNEPCKVHEF